MKKVFYLMGWGGVTDKNMPANINFFYKGKLNQKKESKTFIGPKRTGSEENTYKLQKGKLCKYTRTTAILDLNSDSLTYMGIKPYKGKMKRTCYSK